MFSSNQIFSVSGDLKPEVIKDVLEFIQKMSDNNFSSYQITPAGHFAIGWLDEEKYGWIPFQFEHDLDVLSRIIYNHLLKLNYYDNEWDDYDGSTHDGFRVDLIEETFADEKNGVKRPFYGIVKFAPHTNFFSK